MEITLPRVSALAMVSLLLPAPLSAQTGIDENFAARCASSSLPASLALGLCQDAGVAVGTLLPEAGMALVGGNPVLGTASPPGRRFRSVPRMNIGGRLNFSFVDLPDVMTFPASPAEELGNLDFLLPAAHLDVSVSVFDGFDLATTLGGFAAVELMGSLGAMIYPAGEGFRNDAAGLGLGARIGVLRESFTAPGISVSIYRKWHGSVGFGNVSRGDDAEVNFDLDAWSFRAGLSKSFVSFALGFTLGWDSFSSDVELSLRQSDGTIVTVAAEDTPIEVGTDRWSAYVDFAYVVLFFNVVAEVGWQEGQNMTTSTGDEFEGGNLFASLGLRVSL